MSAKERWIQAAAEVYSGDDDARMFDRATRIKGDADQVIFTVEILHELRAIRQALESRHEGAKPKR